MKKNNVLWIFSDEHRASAMSCMGDDNIQTSHLDQLAKEGILFKRAYSNSPLCSPFRACLVTGKYASQHGVTSLHVPLINQKSIAQTMKEFGFNTSYLGKWHMSGGAAPSHFVSGYFYKGFDSFIGWENSNRFFGTEYYNSITNTNPQKPETLPKYQTDALTDLAIESIMEEDQDTPWFKVVSYEAPHPPHVDQNDIESYQKEYAPKEYLDMFQAESLVLRPNVKGTDEEILLTREKLKAYYAAIKNLDDNIGRLVESLKESGQYENTTIFYFSDHGDFFGSHGKGGKSWAEEESSNIPLIISSPNQIKGGEISNKLFSGIDIAPTMLGMLGLPTPTEMSGMDLSHIVSGNIGQDREEVLIQLDRNFYAANRINMRYRALVTERYKYIFKQKGKEEILYDLEQDPYELQNVAATSDITSKMKEHLKNILCVIEDEFLEEMM